MTVILAATETVTSPGWWQQALSIVITVGAIAGACAAVWKLGSIPKVGRVLSFIPRKLILEPVAERREARRIAELQPALREMAKIAEKLDVLEDRTGVRHRANLHELERIGHRLDRLDVGQKQVNQRIDRHTEEEVKARRDDKAEMLGWFQASGFMRREDVQRLRNERAGDEA